MKLREALESHVKITLNSQLLTSRNIPLLETNLLADTLQWACLVAGRVYALCCRWQKGKHHILIHVQPQLTPPGQEHTKSIFPFIVSFNLLTNVETNTTRFHHVILVHVDDELHLTLSHAKIPQEKSWLKEGKPAFFSSWDSAFKYLGKCPCPYPVESIYLRWAVCQYVLPHSWMAGPD